MKNKYRDLEKFIEATRHVLATLTPREEMILTMRIGIGRPKSTQKEIAEDFSVTQQRISQIEATALRKLRHPTRVKLLNELTTKYQKEISPPLALQDVIEKVDSLTFELIKYLKKHQHEIDKIPWQVFEHLVAEFLASQGFDDVRLVGRDSATSADIYAALLVKPVGIKIRFFVEVKREKKKVGINIINSIFGAISLEKETHGWHAGVIVSVSGFKKIQKHSRTELKLKGIDLKGRQDLLKWLEDYKPNKNGLWLPSPKKKMPKLSELI